MPPRTASLAAAVVALAAPAVGHSAPRVINGCVITQAAKCVRANLAGADLRGADLRSANLRTVNLRGADLRGARLSGANLRKANLTGADLRGADFRGASLQGARLVKVRAGATKRRPNALDAAYCGTTTPTGANFSNANLTSGVLAYGAFAYANFTGATMSGADLSYGTFTCASMAQVNGRSYVAIPPQNSSTFNYEYNCFSVKWRAYYTTVTGADFTGTDFTASTFTGFTGPLEYAYCADPSPYEPWTGVTIQPYTIDFTKSPMQYGVFTGAQFIYAALPPGVPS
jgi:uncharacterized protein YjbI with pentapeptide repeats